MPKRLKAQNHDASALSWWKRVWLYVDWKLRTDRKIRGVIEDTAQTVDKSELPDLQKMMYEKAQLTRSVEFQSFLATVLKRYRVVHVVSSNITFGALALHIVFALMYQVVG